MKMGRYILRKHRGFSELQVVTNLKNTLIIITVVKASNPTNYIDQILYLSYEISQVGNIPVTQQWSCKKMNRFIFSKEIEGSKANAKIIIIDSTEPGINTSIQSSIFCEN
jgi:hypothetical protein